jgi:hypothetical protein
MDGLLSALSTAVAKDDRAELDCCLAELCERLRCHPRQAHALVRLPRRASAPINGALGTNQRGALVAGATTRSRQMPFFESFMFCLTSPNFA